MLTIVHFLLRRVFFYVETNAAGQKLVSDDTGTNIQRVCVHFFAQLEIFFSSVYLRVMSHFLCIIIMCIFDCFSVMIHCIS